MPRPEGSVVLRVLLGLLLRWLVVTVVVTGVVVGVGWLLTHPFASAVDGFDDPVSRWFAARRTPGLDTVADVGTLLGETVVGASFSVLVGAAFALWRRSWRPLAFVVLLEASLGGLYKTATTLDPRDRPPVRILDPGLVPDASFPSGHTATATAACCVVVLLVAACARPALRWVLPLLLVSPYVALSRLYQGAHHVTDVATSTAYAVVLAVVLGRIVLGPLALGPLALGRVAPEPPDRGARAVGGPS